MGYTGSRMDLSERDAFRIGQFAKELVAVRLGGFDDPAAGAAALVTESARVALKSRPEEADCVIADACCGALQALLLAGHDLSRAASLMLSAVQELAADLKRDPAELSSYALEGFARMRRLMRQDQLVDMLDTLESRHPGAGAAFAKALALQPDPSRRLPVG